MKKFKMLILFVLISMPVLVAATYTKGYVVDNNGDMLEWRRWTGFPQKDYVPAGELDKDGPKALVALPFMPAYDWSYGCTATATAQIAAYYDNFGAPGIYTGGTNGGVMPMTNAAWDGQANQADTANLPLAASKEGVDGRVGRGHGDDYWTGYLDEGDPYYGGWTEHDHFAGQPNTANFLGTNQWHNWGNVDGSTSIYNYLAPSGRKLYDMPDQDNGDGTFGRDGNHGWKLFYQSLGMEVNTVFNQMIDGYDDGSGAGPVVDGYTFADFKKSIDKGIPVLLHVVGHSMPAYAYDDAYNPPRVYVRSTWNRDTAHNEFFEWGGSFSNMEHYSMSVNELATKEYYAVPVNVRALNNNRTVTVTWDDPSAGTRNLTYQVFRDGALVGSPATNSFQEVLTSTHDGLRYYTVKAVYTDPNPDIITNFSDPAPVYVSPSVESFYDDFETPWAEQWIRVPDTGVNAWNRATSYVYQGSYSFADSPAGDYANGSDQLPAGGHYAEVAPGLNFTNAADAAATFWMRSEIEDSFDYLHFQASEDGLVWTSLKIWDGEAAWLSGFLYENISLGMYAGRPNVRFRFIMITDPGYTCFGAYIDNFGITPSSVDTTPPFVYYEKVHDFHTDWPNGHWLETRIVDFSGINYARILYRVNGGAEQTLNPSAVNGQFYEFQFPDLADGAMVEFRFDCRDNASPANQGYKGPFYFVHGLHQKYDYGTVDYYTVIENSTATEIQTAYANRFTSFHDDVLGLVVRGYIDSQTGANQPMQINVWADNNGVPGATMITPFNATNPATLQNTNAYGYVDLSSYIAIKDIEGDYYVGFRCAAGGTNKTHTVMTMCAEAGEYDFGRAWIQWNNGASNPQWDKSTGYNHHLRLVTTNYEIEPGMIEPSPIHIVQDVLGTGSRNLEVRNVGGYPLDFTGSIDYVGFASGATVASNNFDTVLGWASSGGRTWTRVTTYDGGNLNGTAMANVASATGGQPTATTDGILTTGVYDLSSYGRAELSFIQKTVMTANNEYCRVEASNNGTTWTTIYQTQSSLGAWNAGNAQTLLVPEQFLTATARFRFRATLRNAVGKYWAIDNVVLQGMVPFSWLTLDGAATTSGTNIQPAAKDDVTVGFNTTGLTLNETYTAWIRLNSKYSNESVKVDLTVKDPGGSLDAPGNVTTSIVGGNVRVSWDAVTGATSYDVYSSADPYGTFVLLGNTANAYYDFTPGTNAKMFFHVVAKNAAKAVPRRTIRDIRKLDEDSGN